jgi:hypothetical protein
VQQQAPAHLARLGNTQKCGAEKTGQTFFSIRPRDYNAATRAAPNPRSSMKAVRPQPVAGRAQPAAQATV